MVNFYDQFLALSSQLDKDSDGTVSAKEVQAYWKSFKKHLTDAKAQILAQQLNEGG